MIKELNTWVLTVFVLILISGCESAPPAPPAPVTLTDEETIEATVVAVDPANSAVTLRGPDGQEGTLVVPEARNLAQVEPGDTLRVSYTMTYRASVAAPGETQSGLAVAAGRAEEGERPGAFIGALAATSMEILSVADDGSTVSFRDETGVLDSMQVMTTEGRDFVRQLKKGDVVILEFAESVTVQVEHPQASS
jgi:hypothetical protein